VNEFVIVVVLGQEQNEEHYNGNYLFNDPYIMELKLDEEAAVAYSVMNR
jgi:hypothetical protein